MATFDDGFKGAVPSILVVLGVAMAAPIVLPAVAAVSRPLAKTLIKGYLALAETAKEYAAEAGEQISDILAECKAEHMAEMAAAEKAAKGKK
jgi:esterase/lipase